MNLKYDTMKDVIFVTEASLKSFHIGDVICIDDDIVYINSNGDPIEVYVGFEEAAKIIKLMQEYHNE